jgi:hypothetical protein
MSLAEWAKAWPGRGSGSFAVVVVIPMTIQWRDRSMPAGAARVNRRFDAVLLPSRKTDASGTGAVWLASFQAPSAVVVASAA